MLIDEKGRIFGKLNIIDFLIICFILIVVPMFFIAGKLMNAKKVDIVAKEAKVTIEAKFGKIIPELARVLKEGDIEEDESGKQIGRLVKIISNEQQRFLALDMSDAGENKVGLAQDSNFREIKAILELKCKEEKRSIVYRGYYIKIGNNINFSTNLYSIQGIITDIKR